MVFIRQLLPVLLGLILFPSVLFSQTLPKENSNLNYRLIGFSFPRVGRADKYKLEIACGNINSEDSFSKKITQTLYCKNKKIIAEVPFFGKQYTWRVTGMNGSSGSGYPLRHFSTGIVPEADTSLTRLRVLKKAGKYKDGFVFLDGARVLYDMRGNPVWYMPDVDGLASKNYMVRDMKLSGAGTITLLFEEIGAYAINYQGEIIWKAPNNGQVSGSKSELFHHELTKLQTGHYMVAGDEMQLWNQKLPTPGNDDYEIRPMTSAIPDSMKPRYMAQPFGTLIEYDEKGNIVWSWKSSDYFRQSDIYYHKGKGGRPEIAAHENSFYFDEKNKVIYVGFRNISRILKISYPEGHVLAVYGENFQPGNVASANDLFCRQHSVRRSSDGYLYLYNNNSCTAGKLPSIVKVEEPEQGGSLKKVWEYVCTTEGASVSEGDHFQFPIGGNVVELADHDIFCNMSGNYSKVFIVDKNKKILWSALSEKRNSRTKVWEMYYNYRASFITSRKDLESLIWNGAEPNP